MRFLILLVVGLLVGYYPLQLPSPVSAPGDLKTSLPKVQADRAVELVSNRKVVGHSDFNNTKKVLMDIY